MSQQHIPVHKFVVRLPDWELPKLQLDLRLSPSGSLQGLGRQECPRCRRSRWLFCYDCATPLPAAPPPRLALPFDFLILTHVQERIGKNTGVQAAIIAPDHVRVAR